METIHKFYRKPTFYFVLIAALFTGFTMTTSCDDDDDEFSDTGTNLSIADIAGNWMANSATFDGTDLLEDGATILLNIQNDGRFTFTIKSPGEADDVTTGKMGFDGEFLAVRFDDDPGEEASFFISLINEILTLRGQTEFDSDDDGMDEFGVLELIMERM